MLIKNGKINEKEGATAIAALRALHKPEQLSPFEKGYLDLLRRQYAQMGGRSPLDGQDKK
jgi:hypothetical protein